MAKPGNNNLHMSKAGKQDEFYTQLPMIENELKYYKNHFEGKTVLCNCDDPYESNFFKFFAMRFNILKLKKLIASCYDRSPIAQTQLSLFEEDRPPQERSPYCAKMIELEDYNGDGAANISDVEWLLKNKKDAVKKLEGNGDFRSRECIELLKQADIVVTNPPFSLFREYVAQLMEYDKKFIILGNINNITYSEITPLYREGKIWLGRTSGHFWFRVPDTYEAKATDFKIDEDGVKWRRMGNICWFTNLDYKERYEDLHLWRKYNPVDYPKYENIDAIHVKECNDIPDDYYGLMGVPVTFCTKHNPKQFEYLGLDKENTPQKERFKLKQSDGTIKTQYARVLIRRK